MNQKVKKRHQKRLGNFKELYRRINCFRRKRMRNRGIKEIELMIKVRNYGKGRKYHRNRHLLIDRK